MTSSLPSSLHFGAIGFNLDQGENYDKFRPSYPLQAVDEALSFVNSHKLHCLDIAAGTGIFTRLLIQQLKSKYGDEFVVDALEPAAAMKEQLLAHTSPLNSVLSHSADAMTDVKDNTYDILFVAQAFHWFDSIEAVREMHRVLKPNGPLVLIWNLEDDREEWVAKMRKIYEAFDGDVPQYRKGTWKDVWLNHSDEGLFGLLNGLDKKGDNELPMFLRCEYHHHMIHKSREALFGLVSSKSYIARQTTEIKEKLKRDLMQLLEDSLGHEKEGEAIPLPYVTNMYITFALKPQTKE